MNLIKIKDEYVALDNIRNIYYKDEKVKNPYKDYTEYYHKLIIRYTDEKYVYIFVNDFKEYKELSEKITNAANENYVKLQEMNILLKERIAYLERSNNRREEEIMNLRYEVSDE